MSRYIPRILQRCKTGLWPVLGLALLLAAGPAGAGSRIKCWVNKDGIRECGQFVPPEYAQQRIEIINERGIVVDVIEAAKSREQLAREAAERRRRAEQKRRDEILLNTFTTERDIELARKSRIQAIESIIAITNSNTRSLKANLNRVQKRAADFERAGEEPPKELFEEMESLKRQIRDNEEFVAKKQRDIIALEKRFDADLKRFRELKGIAPSAEKAPDSQAHGESHTH